VEQERWRLRVPLSKYVMYWFPTDISIRSAYVYGSSGVSSCTYHMCIYDVSVPSRVKMGVRAATAFGKSAL
jgi:hypothetical protein